MAKQEIEITKQQAVCAGCKMPFKGIRVLMSEEGLLYHSTFEVIGKRSTWVILKILAEELKNDEK